MNAVLAPSAFASAALGCEGCQLAAGWRRPRTRSALAVWGRSPELPPPAAAADVVQGHKIKNPRMQLRKHLDAVPARVRVIISGTPIQNNLQEMHTLFDFACPVRALGMPPLAAHPCAGVCSSVRACSGV
jgi:hypothetical protein